MTDRSIRPIRRGRPRGSRNVRLIQPEPVPVDFDEWAPGTKRDILTDHQELLEKHPTLKEAIEHLTEGITPKRYGSDLDDAARAAGELETVRDLRMARYKEIDDKLCAAMADDMECGLYKMDDSGKIAE